MIWTCILTAMFLLAGPAIAQEPGKADRLFRSNDLLDVTITAPFETLMDERPVNEDLPGKFSYTDQDGAIVEFDIGIRTRGRYRHQERVCPFAPLRLNFKKAQTTDTLFHKQNKLKLVTHCRDSSGRYEQVTLKEYLAYRFLNEMTDLSFRVRLLRVNYVDIDHARHERKYYGFLIERGERLSKRIKLPLVKIRATGVSSLVGSYTNLISVFQYYVANTDFSPIAGAPGDICCHNTYLFGEQGQLYYSIPYDFDMAGLTDAPYATPDPKFQIRNVRQRLYRGRCPNNKHLPATLQVFRDNRELFFSMVGNLQDLSGSSKTSMYALMERFYKLIDNPKAVDKHLVRRCI